MTKFYVSGIRIGDNPIGGGAEMCEKNVFAIETQGMAPKHQSLFCIRHKTKIRGEDENHEPL